MTYSKSRFCFFIRVVELGDRNALNLRNRVEMIMIEVTHFSAFVLTSLEKFTL